MKLITLIEMMENPEYQSLSCGEFAHIVRRSGVLDEVTKDDEDASDDFYHGASTDQSKNMDYHEINSYMEA